MSLRTPKTPRTTTIAITLTVPSHADHKEVIEKIAAFAKLMGAPAPYWQGMGMGVGSFRIDATQSEVFEKAA